MRSVLSSLAITSLLLTGCSTFSGKLDPETLANQHKQQELIALAETTTSVTEKVELLKESGSLGSADAYFQLAKTYATDSRFEQDSAKSDYYMAKADELGNTSATMMLAWSNMYGMRTEKNEEKGISMMKKAAKSDLRAQREMGLMYGNLRHPFLNNESKGFKLLVDASKKGDAEAGYYAYILGSKLKNEGRAIESLKAAANLGQPKALLVLGRDELEKTQYMLARDHFLEAALAYDSEAMFELGKGIASGIFPPSQTVEGISKEAEAYVWLSESASQKHLQAEEELNKLKDNVKIDENFKQQTSQVAKSIKEQTKTWNPNNI